MRKMKFLRTYGRLIQKHWFSVALLIMLFGVIVQQKTAGLQDNKHKPVIMQPVDSEKPPAEKYTDEMAQGERTSVLGNFSKKSDKCALPTIPEEQGADFIKRFGRVVIAEQKKYGIPASVLIVTAYVNSFAGTRACAKNANNYFALSCVAVKGKSYDENGRCKTKLNTAWEGFRTFSMYLEIQPWLSEAKNTAGLDAEIWLEVFEKMELSDVENFSKEAKNILKRYDLTALDRP